jgi:hypothetical protein
MGFAAAYHWRYIWPSLFANVVPWKAAQALRNSVSKLGRSAQDTFDAMEDSQAPQQHNRVL